MFESFHPFLLRLFLLHRHLDALHINITIKWRYKYEQICKTWSCSYVNDTLQHTSRQTVTEVSNGTFHVIYLYKQSISLQIKLTKQYLFFNSLYYNNRHTAVKSSCLVQEDWTRKISHTKKSQLICQLEHLSF